MRYCIWILSLLGLLFGPSHAFAHGAIAVSEDDRGQAQVQYSFDDATSDEAQSEALLDCASTVQRTCLLVATYKDTCAGFARLFPNQYFVRLAPDADSAKQAALSACFSAYPGKLAETACPRYNFVYCDRTPVSYQSSAPATQTFDYGSQQRSPFNEPLIVWYWIGLFVFVVFLIAWILKTPGRQATPSIQAASGVPSTAPSSHETVNQPTPHSPSPAPPSSSSPLNVHPEQPANASHPSYASSTPPTPPPRPERLDTNGAVEDMRLARSYLDDWYEKSAERSALSFAASYIEKARGKDPDAKLVVPTKNKDDDPDVYSQNDLAGEVLYCEALIGYEPTAPRDILIRAAQTLSRAIAFCPYSIAYRSKLADVYLDLYDRKSALVVAREALAANPKTLDARKLVDRIEAAPDLQPPAFFERNPDAIAPIGIIMVVAGIALVIYTFTQPSNNFVSLLLWVLFGGGAIVWYRGRKKEDAALLDKAIAEQHRKRMKK